MQSARTLLIYLGKIHSRASVHVSLLHLLFVCFMVHQLHNSIRVKYHKQNNYCYPFGKSFNTAIFEEQIHSRTRM